MPIDAVEREAKLFEAGNYPDRGIEITEEDLDRIVENTADAPIRIEHTLTPFDGALGVLKCVYRKGRELFGRLCFTRAAWELVKAAGARRLSVALKKDKSGIAEVSLVREPRIEDAAVFGDVGVVFAAGAEIELGSQYQEAGPEPDSAEAENRASAYPAREDVGEVLSEAARLRRELEHREAQANIDRLKRQGKLVPASEVFARAILESGDSSVITFGGSPTPISQLFLWFLDSQPKVIEFAELAAAGRPDDEEPEIFTKLGVSTSQVERYRNR
ncbi:MAG: hypothetical protein ACP5R5_09505 [Armatimonadota bacterium]